MKNFTQVNRALAAEKNFYTNLNQIKSNPDGEPTVNRQSRLMSYRGNLRNLAMIFAVLVMSIGNVWGANYYILSGKINVPLTRGMSSSSYQVVKSDGSTLSTTTDISGSITDKTAGVYYNGTSVAYADLSNLSNYSTSSGENRTIQAIKIANGATLTITLNSKTFSKMDVIYRCESDNSKSLKIDGTNYNTSDKNIHKASIEKSFSTSISIANESDKNYDVFVILTESSGKCTLAYDANGGTGSMPTNEFASGTAVYAAQNAGFTAPSGKIFKCWNTEANGSGTSYGEWESFTLSANTTLYAQWITASTSTTYCISLYNLNVSNQMKYFTYSGSNDMQILDMEVPNYKTDKNNFWVGKGGEWKSSGLGNSNAQSAEEKLEDLCLKGNRGQKLGTSSQGVLARFFIYDNSMYNNLYIEFTPKQYSLIWGEDGKDWSPVKLYPSGCENEWTSEVVTLTSDHISSDDWKYYVGILKADDGVAYWYKSKTSTIKSMGTYNKPSNSWGGNVSTLSAGDKGFFRMWQDATSYDNWRCHFVPVYTLSYNANGGEGAPASAYTATEGDDAARTLKVSTTEPTRTGYTFEGWAESSGATEADYTAGATITLTADKTLYAVWNCITPDAPAAAKITATDGCAGSAGATFSADDSGKPSYVTWYWQTASDGTSTSYPVSSDYETASTAGSKTMYVRAKNTACDTWSTATSKSATVKTAATIAWNTAPADGLAGGSMTASVTSNYSAGVAYSVQSATPAGCVTVGASTGVISYVAAGTATIRATVTGAGDYCSSAYVDQAITVTAAASLTAIEENTLYQPLNMLCTGMSPLPSGDTYFTDDAYSTDNRFYYDVSSGNGPKAHTISEVTLGSGQAYEATFTSEMWVKGTSTVTDGIPSAPSIKFLTPSTSGTLYLYIESSSCPVKFKKEDGTASNITGLTQVVSGKIYSTTVEANSVYYIYGNGESNTGVYGLKLITCSTPAAPTAFSAGSITSTGATFTITDAAGAASYDIYYSTSSTAPTASTAATVTSDSKTKTVTGLTANTTYYAWVRSVCDADHKSAWVALTSPTAKFSTAAAAALNDGCWDPANTAADKLTSGDVTLTTFDNNFSGVTGITSVTLSKGTGDGKCSGADETPTSSGYLKVKNATTNKIITIVTTAAKDITIGGEPYGSNTGSFYLVKSTAESTKLAECNTGATSKATNCPAGTYYVYAKASTKSINFSLLCIEDAAPDVTAPTFVSSNPANGATGVATSGTIVLTFSEPLGSVDESKFTLTGATKGAVAIDGSDATKVNIAYSGAANEATVTLATAAGAVSDAAGNSSAALSDISFTTVAAGACPTGGDVFTLEMTYTGGSAVKVDRNSTKAWSDSYGDADGGTITLGNVSTSSDGAIQIKKTGILFFNSTDGYVKIDMDCPLKTGDVLTFTSDESKEICFTKDATYNNTVKTSDKKWTVPSTYNNVSTIYIWRAGSNSVNLHTINIVRPVTVTFDKNGGSSVSPTSATYDGTSSCVLATPVWEDYHLDGWNTRADGNGTDLGLPGETYHLDVTTNTTTVYAKWSAKSCASGTIYKFQVSGSATNGNFPKTTEVYVKTSDPLSIMTGGYLKAYNSSSDKLSVTNTSKICINSSSSYLLVLLDCPLQAGDKIKSTVTDQTMYVTKADASRTSTVTLPIAANNEQVIPAALVGATELKIWAGSSNGGKISLFEIIRESSTYNVTYNGNDETGGTAPTDATNYAYNAEVTVKGNSGSLAKTNYAALAYWNTKDDGTGTDYAIGSGTFNITANTTLYAKWTQAVTLNANTANGGSTGGSATAVWNATALTGITHATPAAGYKLIGYYTTATDEPTTGVKVLNASGTFSSTTVADYITSGKWSRTGEAPTLYARYEASAGLTWNLTVNAKIDLTTESKTSDYPQVGSMTDVATNGLSVSKSAKANLTSIIQTVSSLDPDKYVKATFVVASGYKFTPSKIKLKVQPKDNAETIKVVLTDGVRTYEHDFGSQSAGSIHSLEATNADADKYMQGTVTLKIYAYGNTTGYRLGTPITIEGAVTATCDMPTYTSVDHGATEYQEGDEAESLSVVGGAHVNTYQWYWNTANDRSDVSKTAATAADGTGYNTYTFTPQTTSAYSRYYWCELTATDCGTIKTEAVGITVTEVKTSASIDWTDPVGTVHYGGGGYTIKATVKETTWAGGPEDLTLSAPEGIRIYNVTRGTTDSKDWIQANFDVQTSFDRETYSSSIPFVVSAPAQTGWDAINDEHGVTYDACAGGGGEGSAFIEVTSGVTTANTGMSNYWEAAGVGRLNKAYNQAMGSSADAQTIAGHAFSYRTGANNSNWMVNTYIAGVTKIRLYFYASAAIASGKLGISKVLYDTEYFNSQGSRAVVFDNVATSADSYAAADKGWIEFTLPEMAANSYCYFATNTGNLYIYGVELFSGSVGTGGTETTNLTWSDGTVDGGSVTGKTQSSANFTITATRDAVAEKSLGAITYSSSNTSCATVDSETGEVTITATGASELTTTITATLAASGCYKKKEITYTLTIPGVTCSIETGTLTSDVTSKCSTVNATLTLTGFESGASIQWYKGESTISDDATYHITTEGTTSTLVTKEAGTYSVMVSKTTPTSCSDRSNSITISNASASASATKIVDSWYVKNGRLTPDIELWSVSEGATLGSVAWSPANETGLNCVLRDGIVYLEGKEPNANESGADKVYTLTLTLKDACGGDHEEITKTITITHQKNTDKHVLAFVVNGTKNGGFTAGISADQTTNLDLYKKISAEFDVLATNAYATDDEKALKQYYSQFDILCITDYPNTGEKGNNKKSYIDAMGSIVDIRPILTMEAFVAKWGNWKAKDISGTPHSPDPRQYAMDLQCKDHEIFDGTHPEVVGEGDEAMYRVTMVDATKEDYATLDGNTPGTDAYDADDYPALQGFEFDATMAADGLLPLGQIYNGSPTNTLQVGIERQTEMSARLMVLGIQQLAMERLTADGQTVVINALKYLMKKNEEEIADCSVAFVGGAEDGLTTDWNNDANWSTGKKPDKTTREVRILAPVVITNSQTITSPTIKIADGGTYDGGTTANGSITINAGGALKVKGEVVGVTAPAYSKKKATDPSKLVLNTSETAQSALILDNENGMTRATVNLYSLGRKIDSKYQFQYYAVPMEVVPVNPSFAGTGIYTYVWHENGGWERRGYYTDLYAFEGIGITTSGAAPRTYTMTGNLASTADKEITLTKESDGENIIGNSWTAPINIASLRTGLVDDANIVDKTVYIYITGNDNKTGSHSSEEVAGKWLAIPIDASGWPDWTGQKVIPAMQAFYIKANAATTLTLNYDEMVRTTPNGELNRPLKAPRRAPLSDDAISLLKLRVEDSSTHTDLYLFEGNRFSDSYDNGWEAKQMGGDGCMQLYAQNDADKMAVLATDELEGTVVGFEPGKETGYTISFSGEGNGYYLNDVKMQTSTLISEENTYSFDYEAGDAANRFYISRTAINAPAVATGMENLDAAAPRAQKIIYNDKLYIIRGGRLYDATGKVVK